MIGARAEMEREGVSKGVLLFSLLRRERETDGDNRESSGRHG